MLVLAPWSVQEAADLVQDAFDLADFYRNPVVVLGDGLIGQMMEPVEFKEYRKPCKPLTQKGWATTGWKRDGPRRIINSLYLDPNELEAHNRGLQAKYEAMRRDEVRYAAYSTDQEYEILLVAYGTVARVCSTAMEDLKESGIRAALIRPISLFPFPYDQVRSAAARAKSVLVVELSAGQMVEDVKLAVQGAKPVHFYGRMGGMVATPEEVVTEVRRILTGRSEEVRHA